MDSSESDVPCADMSKEKDAEQITENIPKKWQEIFEEGKLSAREIRDYWKYFVPNLLSPQPHCNCLRITYDEEQIQKVLFDPLEKFMFGMDPSAVFQMIRDLHDPPSFCGRVFKSGDPTYGCRDCGMDPTCVLCVDCFKNSAHNKHRYKISTSSGGGYCDCGDKEAWKSDVFCHVHIKGELADPQKSNILTRLPPDLVERVQIVFDTILQYAKELIMHTDNFNLPRDLEVTDWERDPTNPSKLFDPKDTYVTMLYNDETHTYDQVINVLTKSIECSKRDAVAYATAIDREGRCIVISSTFQLCNRAKESMDKHQYRPPAGKKLKVQVVHVSIIAHQVFALRLLQWLNNVLESAQAFRLIFTDIASRDNCQLIESIFRADTQMWKNGRIQWHRIFISGMLMEMDSKRTFAKIYTKHYSKMMKDFIQDDHEHSVCVVSLGVQIFTIPTIAQMLIGEEDVLSRLFTTFLSECRKNVSNGKLSLSSRGYGSTTFKRIQYTLFDLKYLLCFKPDEWTNELRRGFLHGFDQLLQLLSLMQGMDPTVRQVGQHMEFEPEWESSFNMHIKLSSILPLIIEWAASDQVVLIKAYRMVLKSLGEHITEDMKRKYVRELLDYSVSCIEYDVSSATVSLHLPLTRLIAGFTIHLDKYGFTYNSVEFSVKKKPSVEELMEPVIRTQVMIAQVNAGMWRRNGYSLNNQIYFYQNVRCRQEMYDRDIMLLQEAASLIDANEFLIHILNRYNLINWAKEDFEANYFKNKDEDNIRQVTMIAEECLKLIMTLIAERFTPGIGKVKEEDCIQKEIIQLLCIEQMPHSVLNKSLPEGVNHETGMEKVIDKVAQFKKASAEAKCFFELKEEYYKEYNLFFHHYSREEQSKAEVIQHNRKKALGEPVCCPPPIPPPFTAPFTLLVNILQCDIFLHIARIILQRIGEPKSESVSELMLQIILHMIGYALHEEERYIRNEDPYFRFTTKAQAYCILPLLEFLVGNQRTATHKDMLLWTIKRFYGVINLYSKSNGDEKPKSKLEDAGEGPSRVALISSDKKRKAVAERKARIMAKMANMQKNFITKNKSLFSEASTTESAPAEMAVPTPMELEEVSSNSIAIGPERSSRQSRDSVYTCILCHQEETIVAPTPDDAKEPPVMVLGCLVQKSSILSRNRKCVTHIRHPDQHDTLVLPSDLHWGVHISSCSHAMHAECWRRYFEDISVRERRKPHRGQNLSFDIEKEEYLCPLCESLCNTAIPILPDVLSKLEAESSNTRKINFDFSASLKAIKTVLQFKTEKVTIEESTKEDAETSSKSKPVLKDPLRSGRSIDSPTPSASAYEPPVPLREKIGPHYQLPPIEEVVEKLKEEALPEESIAEFRTHFVAELHPFFRSGLASDFTGNFLLGVYKHGLCVDPDHMNSRILEMIWTSTAYSIRVIEEYQRCSNRALLTSLSQRVFCSLAALVKFSLYSPYAPHSKGMAERSTLRLLSLVLDTPCDNKSLCALQWDPFSVLISLSLGLPSVFPQSQNISRGSSLDLFLLQLALYNYIFQVLLLSSEDRYKVISNEDEPMPCEDEDQSSNLINEESRASILSANAREAQFIKDLLLTARSYLGLETIEVDSDRLLEHVKQQCLPFLRCCALYFNFVTEVKPPEELESSVWVPESEYLCLLRYLGLSSHLQEVFNYPAFKDVLKTWCSHPGLKEYLSEWNSNLRSFDLCVSTNQLISLPNDYSELMNMVAQVPCPASMGDDSRTPTMCLICGEMLCSQSYCCQMELPEGSGRMVGACTYHAHFCGAGTGIFLRVRECKILLLSGRIKGCYYPPPYLDNYGETDTGLKRGNPLHLDENLYCRLHNMWLNHSVPDVIAHTMENTNNLLINEWFHF